MLNTSVSIENFVKTIFQAESVTLLGVKTGLIAGKLGISSAATTDMAKKLAVKELVVYTKYQDIKLTDKGEKLAASVIRKHRLWETFLHKVLGLSLHEIHREAENLEHLTSDFLAEKISEYLGNPLFDPHGDPIPDSEGKTLFSPNHILLSLAAPNQKYEIVRLFNTDKEFFDFCLKNSILPGNGITVENQYIQSKMTEISVNQSRLLLNEEFTKTIYVKII